MKELETPAMVDPAGLRASGPCLFYRWDLLVTVVAEVILVPELP